MIEYIEKMINSGGMWLVPALIASLIVVQFIKDILKTVLPPKHKYLRKKMTQVMAFGIGYTLGLYLLDSPDAEKWAVLTGICNPTLYMGLKSYARSKKIVWLESVLKMRPPVTDESGNVVFSPDETLIVSRNKLPTEDAELRRKLEAVAKEHNSQ
jgi:hypothetical protein